MSNYERPLALAQFFGKRSQPCGGIFNTLTPRRAEGYRITAPSSEEVRRITLRPLGRLTFPLTEIDFPQCRLDLEWDVARDELARLQASSHRADQTALELKVRKRIAGPRALQFAMLAERRIRRRKKALR